MMNQMQNNMMSEFARFQSNPQQYMIEKGFNLQPGMLNDPQKAVEYLINSNQGTAEQLNQFKSMLSMFH
jgi:hypothetical protein